jgi:hypothetical protein
MLQPKADQQVADQSSIPPTSISESGGHMSDLGNAAAFGIVAAGGPKEEPLFIAHSAS